MEPAIDAGALVERLDRLVDIPRTKLAILAAGSAATPALAAFLARKPSVLPQPRVAAAECLGVIGGEEAVGALLTQVRRDHRAIDDREIAFAEESVRNAAARALERVGDPRVTATLLDVLAADRLIGAGETLAALGERRAIPFLVDCLEDDVERERATEALRHFGSDAVPALIAALTTPSRRRGRELPSSIRRRVQAARLLGELRTSEAVSALRTAAERDDAPVNVAAALALMEIGPLDVDPSVLIIGLDADDATMRDDCDAALRRCGARAATVVRYASVMGALPRLRGAARRLSARTRVRAIAILAAVDRPVFLEVSPTLLADDDDAVRVQTLRELAGGPPSLKRRVRARLNDVRR